jgi:hypothetical protein
VSILQQSGGEIKGIFFGWVFLLMINTCTAAPAVRLSVQIVCLICPALQPSVEIIAATTLCEAFPFLVEIKVAV